LVILLEVNISLNVEENTSIPTEIN